MLLESSGDGLKTARNSCCTLDTLNIRAIPISIYQPYQGSYMIIQARVPCGHECSAITNLLHFQGVSTHTCIYGKISGTVFPLILDVKMKTYSQSKYIFRFIINKECACACAQTPLQWTGLYFLLPLFRPGNEATSTSALKCIISAVVESEIPHL